MTAWIHRIALSAFSSIGVFTPAGCGSGETRQVTAVENLGSSPELVQGGNREVAMFGAGCFWGVEEAFRKLKGVMDTAVGYSGGWTKNPTYEEVCSHQTGHAEVVRIEYDPSVISYRDLLRAFWDLHNPAVVGGQHRDSDSQYRSVIFYHTPEQKAVAEKSKRALERRGSFRGREIATQIEPAGEFWKAEAYHQQYLLKRGLASCH